MLRLAASKFAKRIGIDSLSIKDVVRMMIANEVRK
jgi:hypothetical protein